MYTLGIETSCDETSAAVVKDGRKILSNVVASSLNWHKKYGGIVPEIAFRKQMETITEVVDSSIKEAGVKLKNIDLISVTKGPGLLGSLLVGISFAKSLSLSLDVPLLGVDHLYSHIYASSLEDNIRLPFISLIVSGGHTSLFYVEDFDKIKLIGSTLDDACGEAYDKVAKILGLGYPGGPFIEKIAKKGNPRNIKFRCSGTNNPLDFSFSGIKTGVLYYIKNKQLDLKGKSDIAASFQETVIDALVRKALLACQMKRMKTLVIGGGVAANNRLRDRFFEEAKVKGIKCYFPSKKLCMDNAAMVAGFGYQLFRKGKKSDLTLNAQLN